MAKEPSTANNRNGRWPNLSGREPGYIDWPLFEELCHIHCTQGEICAVMRIQEDTLTKRVEEHYGLSYSKVVEKFQSEGKMSLRRSQFKMAQTKPQMSIWLGKNLLGQKDDVKEMIGEEVENKFNLMMLQLADMQKRKEKKEAKEKVAKLSHLDNDQESSEE